MKKETFDKIKKSLEERKKSREQEEKNSRVLINDSLNTFIRCFVTSPAMNEDGIHIGGISGFLKSMGKAIRKIDPTRCIVVFDGKGGSQRRRDIYPEYKKGRKSKRNLNRQYEGMEDPDEAMNREIHKLARYLKALPLTVITLDRIEADDVIGYLTKQVFDGEDEETYVMSSDKDFLQLVDETTKVWAPKKEKIYDVEKVVDDHGFPPENYLLTRLIEGDSSDNIDGVYGIGEKKIEKKFGDFLKCEKSRNVDDLISYAQENKEKSSTYKRLLDNEDVLRRNWKLMQLKKVNISGGKKLRIEELVEKPCGKLNRTKFQKHFMEDKLWSAFPSVNTWLTDTFSKINDYAVEK